MSNDLKWYGHGLNEVTSGPGRTEKIPNNLSQDSPSYCKDLSWALPKYGSRVLLLCQSVWWKHYIFYVLLNKWTNLKCTQVWNLNTQKKRTLICIDTNQNLYPKSSHIQNGQVLKIFTISSHIATTAWCYALSSYFYLPCMYKSKVVQCLSTMPWRHMGEWKSMIMKYLLPTSKNFC
jgi:hypothetical protein